MEQMADSNSSSESSLCSETALNEFGSDDNDDGVVAQQGIFVNQRKPLASEINISKMSSENYNILSITILKYLLHLSQHVSRSFKLINLFL